MYQYTDFDRAFLAQRVDKFRDQVARRLTGALTEDEFKPLRLMNGLYLMLHAYMLRIAIPYGTLSSAQMRQLALIADKFDKGYGHFTTRQNIQFNWPKLREVPDILAALAEVDMHAIQSSGSCVRNVTADHFAGAAADETDDPRPTAELIRQWSTDHDEFAYLPRKFKVAVIGGDTDRAVSKMHDVGLKLVRGENNAPGYEVSVGGGLGRTPMVARVIRDFLPREDILPYLEAILQTYNLLGRRDNKYKARIKITVHEMGLEQLRTMIEDNFKVQRGLFKGADQTLLAAIEADFLPPLYLSLPADAYATALNSNPAFRSFNDTNTASHKNPDYKIVTVSLKAHGETPGDATSDQMRALADMAQEFSHDELRVSHEQNIILPHVNKAHLPALYARLQDIGLATANIGLISDMIACPGMDYCDLATARSIPVAQQIAKRFDELKLEQDIGPLKLKISGCINACGHHHVGHIGILGLEKAGIESYQITLGGDGSENAAVGKPMGPGFAYDAIVPAIERLIFAYLDLRTDAEETFLQTFKRLGNAPFKIALY
ncbi:MAG: sulfite reductase (NADPH) hemoprotein beta-component, partial [Paracoccaceae bacterium]